MVDMDTIDTSHVLSAISIDRSQIIESEPKSMKDMLEDYEKKIILAELDANEGNVSQTARKLNIDRANFYRKLRNYGIVKTEE